VANHSFGDEPPMVKWSCRDHPQWLGVGPDHCYDSKVSRNHFRDSYSSRYGQNHF
jgi:hypothetical protein